MFARIFKYFNLYNMSIPLTLIGILFVISVIVLPSKMNTFGRLTSICVLKCLCKTANQWKYPHRSFFDFNV